MKVKNWLYPLVLIVGTVAAAIALFFPLYQYIYANGLIHQILGNYGVFTNFAGLDLYATYVGITGVFASSYLILAFVGLLLSVVLTVLKLCGFDIKNYPLCNKIAAGVALVGTIGFVVSAVTFICINQFNLGNVAYPDATKGIEGTFALWLAMGGVILGTIASFLSARDIKEHEVKQEKVETKQEKQVEIVVEKPTEEITEPKVEQPAPKKQQAPIIVAKAEKPKAQNKKTAKTVKQSKQPENKPKTTAKTKTAAKAKPEAKTQAKSTSQPATKPTEKQKTKTTATKTTISEPKPAVVKKAETAKKAQAKKESKPAVVKKAQAKKAAEKKVATKKTTTKTVATKKTTKK